MRDERWLLVDKQIYQTLQYGSGVVDSGVGGLAEEEALGLGITKASLRASTSQRCNRYFLADEEEEEGGSTISGSDRSESQESDFDSSDGNDEEDRDHIM